MLDMSQAVRDADGSIHYSGAGAMKRLDDQVAVRADVQVALQMLRDVAGRLDRIEARLDASARDQAAATIDIIALRADVAVIRDDVTALRSTAAAASHEHPATEMLAALPAVPVHVAAPANDAGSPAVRKRALVVAAAVLAVVACAGAIAVAFAPTLSAAS